GAGVVIVLRLLRHGERAGDRHLDCSARVRAQERHVLHLDRVAPPDRASDSRHRVRVATAVERGAGIVDVDPVQRGGEAVRVTLPAHLPVGQYVQAGLLLRPDGEQGGVPLRLVTLSGPSPDRALVTWSASPGRAEIVSASPIVPTPASQDGSTWPASPMTWALARPARASPASRRVSGSSSVPSTRTRSLAA